MHSQTYFGVTTIKINTKTYTNEDNVKIYMCMYLTNIGRSWFMQNSTRKMEGSERQERSAQPDPYIENLLTRFVEHILEHTCYVGAGTKTSGLVRGGDGIIFEFFRKSSLTGGAPVFFKYTAKSAFKRCDPHRSIYFL